MKTNGNPTLKIGMSIIYRGAWGVDEPKETKVESIELCETEDEKYGEPVNEVSVQNIHRSTFILADGHWCYGWQITEIIG